VKLQVCLRKMGIALAELISYIEEKRQDEDVKVFKLVDLAKLYIH